MSIGYIFRTLLTIWMFVGEIAGLQAREPYHVKVTVDSVTATVSDPNLVDLRRSLKSSALHDLIPIYTPTSAVSFGLNLRGILAQAAFAENSTTLMFTIPQLGITEAFTGQTRDDSVVLFKNFMNDAGKSHGLLKAYARFSPIDPIAGNPNSLMAQMAQSDYLLGHLSPLSGCDCCWSAQPIRHQFQIGANYGRSYTRGFETATVTFPLRYSYSPSNSWALILDAPLTYNKNGGASSIVSSFGLGFRYPLTNRWSVTPVLRFGAGGSLDLCTSGSFFSSGVISVYNYKFSDYVLSLTNYASYLTSTNLWLSGINFNYNLHNFIYKNGLSLTTCKGLTLFNKYINICFSFVDSYFARELLYIKHYDEIGVSIIANGINPRLCYDCLILGFTYQFGQQEYRGFYFNLAYQF